MKKVIFIILSMGVLSTGLMFAHAKEINLKESFNVDGKQKAVMFTHDAHKEFTNNDCSACHLQDMSLKNLKTGEALDTTSISGLNNPFHVNFCWECHTERKVSVGKNCAKCHTGDS